MRGFTLLELAVVVSILVILAGVLLPKFDLFKTKANEGVAATSMTDVSRMIQTYFAQNGNYPDNWDSLMTAANTGGGTATSGNLWDTADASQDGAQLDPQTVGGPPAGATPQKLTLGTALLAPEARSLARMGITTVLDVTVASTALPNDRFTGLAGTTRLIGTGTILPTLNLTDPYAQTIVAHIYPNSTTTATGIPNGKRLVVLGFGSHSTSVGTLVQEVPFYPNTDVTKYYSRFLCVFEVDSAGAQANLMAVIGADGDLIGDEISYYYAK